MATSAEQQASDAPSITADATLDNHAAASIKEIMPPSLIVPIIQLPPLPNPRYRTRRTQSITGITMVLGAIGILVGLTHGIALTIGFDQYSIPWWIFLVLVYGQAGVALVCLAILWAVDPGVVPRTEETCYPIPPELTTWLETRQDKDRPSELYLSSQNATSRDTYCTRCLVWRQTLNTPAPGEDAPQVVNPTAVNATALPEATIAATTKYFHCNVCQRCVGHFDHHCDFFGRCIAGRPLLTSGATFGSGNLPFFSIILGVGVLAYVTCLAAILGGLIHAYDPKYVVPIFLGAFIFLHVCSPWAQRLIGSLRRLVCSCCSWMDGWMI